MTSVIPTLRAIIRDELSRWHGPDLAQVTEVFARTDEGGEDNHQVTVRLRSSGVELARVPVVAARAGISCLPRVDDLVLVTFLNGDLNAPVALGSVYDETSRPPVAEPDEIVYQPPEDEKGGVRRLHVELPGGATLTVEDEIVQITSGDTSVVINRDGDVEIAAAGNLALSAAGDVELKADGAINIEAGSSLSLKGSSDATLEGGSSATVKGAQVKLAGMTEFSAS